MLCVRRRSCHIISAARCVTDALAARLLKTLLSIMSAPASSAAVAGSSSSSSRCSRSDGVMSESIADRLLDECPACPNEYSSTLCERRPRTLACGHSICERCALPGVEQNAVK